MFDFYKSFYSAGYLPLSELENAVIWNVLTKEEFQEITGQAYKEGESA